MTIRLRKVTNWTVEVSQSPGRLPVNSFKGRAALAEHDDDQAAIIPEPRCSGMVSKLAPALGIDLPTGPVAHEKFRHALEAAVHARPDCSRR